MLNKTILDTWLGKNVREFCPHTTKSHISGDEGKHCAHFVSHVLNIDSPKRKNQVIRGVEPLRKLCANFRLLTKGEKGEGLVFVAKEKNIVFKNGKCTMIKPKRHVGLYLNGTVWHYENLNLPLGEKVVSQDVWTQKGISNFHNRYGKDCKVYIADLPPGVTASTFVKPTPQ